MKDASSVFVRDHVNPMARTDWNHIRLRDGWSVPTARTTTLLALWCWENGYKFATEVKMKNGLRADLVVPELYGSQIIEVVDTETEDSLARKRKKYSLEGLEFLSVPASFSEAVRLVREVNNL